MADESNPSDPKPLLRQEPIQRVIKPIVRFMHVEAASGVVLVVATVAALILANSPLSDEFAAFWKTHITIEIGSFSFSHPLYHLVNDGLMAIFFFVIGLEVKREIVLGELRSIRQAALPIAAALGGMIVPAGIYFVLQINGEATRGWGIPMATDIAFVVGCMAILGSRVPHSLRIFLLSLAIADDIGAILVIAIGYTDDFRGWWLVGGLAAIAFVLLLQRLRVRAIGVYVVVGAFLWFAFHESGVHATIAGVILGLMTPARSYLSESSFGQVLRKADEVFHGQWDTTTHRTEKLRKFRQAARETISPVEYLENTLHPWVGFFIMPIFALANAGVAIDFSQLGNSVAVAVILGLFVGKPLGIFLFSWLAVKANLAQLPSGVGWKGVLAGGCLCGIGFTMALFIAGLAFKGDEMVETLATAKIGILAASLLSGALGVTLMLVLLPKPPDEPTADEKE